MENEKKRERVRRRERLEDFMILSAQPRDYNAGRLLHHL